MLKTLVLTLLLTTTLVSNPCLAQQQEPVNKTSNTSNKFKEVIARSSPDPLEPFPLADIGVINAHVNAMYEYQKEALGLDHWKTPQEFLSDGGGDCEDFAIFKYFMIDANKEMLDVKDISMTIVFDAVSTSYHAILNVDGMYLDNKDDTIITDLDSTPYVLIGEYQP